MKSAPFFLTSVFVLLFFNVSVAQFSQPGELDTTFNFGKAHQYFSDAWNPTPGGGASSTVEQIIELSGGKSFIVGDFQTYNGIVVNRTARLNPDGSLDGSFLPGTGANNIVYTAALQSNGKYLVGGAFTSFSGANRNRIVRLNTDGSIDQSFTVGTGFNDIVKSIALQPDGKVLVAGEFTSFNGSTWNRIVRLNSNGSVDASFNLVQGANNAIDNIYLLPNGKILIGGDFTNFNGITRNRLALLNSNGNLDTLFNIGSGANGTIEATELQSDGKILIGGSFTTYNGVARNYIARIHSNGSLDTSFVPTSLSLNFVKAISIQSNGNILIGGLVGFASNGFSIRRLNSLGALDNTFQSGNTGFGGTVLCIRSLSNGEILISGEFSLYQSIPRSRIAKLKLNGSLDVNFNLGTGSNGELRVLKIQANGKILISGNLSLYNDQLVSGLVRINSDGLLDTSFNTSVNGYSIHSILLQPDDKILIAGSFSSVNGVSINRIARLNPNGTLDNSFMSGFSNNSSATIRSMVLQSDGKIVIAGRFNEYFSLFHNGIVRLNPNGSIDYTFNSGVGIAGSPSSSINKLELLPNNKFLIGGNFDTYNGFSRPRIARLNSNGTIDASFNANISSAEGSIYNLSIMSDGKLVISGSFTNINNFNRNYIARLHLDGVLDTTFDNGSTFYGSFSSLVPLSNGSLIATVVDNSNPNSPKNLVTKINVNGTFSSLFYIDSGANSGINSSELQADGKLLIVGSFTKYRGVHRNRIARVHTGAATVGIGSELLRKSSVQAFPSPFTSQFQITASEPFQYELYTIEGKRYTTGFSSSPELSLSTSAWPSGTYILRIITEEGVSVRKLVKE